MTNLTTIIEEQSSSTYRGTLKDDAGTLVPSLDSLTLTLWDEESGNVVNARNGQDILNANGGSFNSGLLTFAVTPPDTTIVDATKEMEFRRMTLTFVWNAGLGQKTHAVRFPVRNLRMIV